MMYRQPVVTCMRKIELLAPARDLHCGIAAIEHGADAVYIGGPQFGARAAAGNSLPDLAKLVAVAHQFRARVYVAMNTVFTDRELVQAAALAWQLHAIGVDALIIQDVGLLECDLPPIALHASTQMNNQTPAKVAFLEQVGFQQVVLARELSLAAIREIRAASGMALEFFVHGALCVSYSGQCYMSEVMAGRSANRGECAQFCRHRYTLRDGRGTVLARDRYLLSLKDLDLSSCLAELIAAGIDSFKIEGRLKDVNYVKNVTAFYRLALDAIIASDGGLARASSGRCSFAFTPDPARSFNRGHTDYYLTKRRNRPGAIDSPKSLGQELGRVVAADRHSFTLATGETVGNGDGLCFFAAAGKLTGLKVNRVADGRIYPKDAVIPPRGTTVYRNADAAFAKLLAASRQCRTLAVRLDLRETADGLLLAVSDEDGVTSETRLEVAREVARQAGSAALQAARQLKRSGSTIFAVAGLTVDLGAESFYPAAVFNELRRRALAHHGEVRLAGYPRQHVELPASDVPWPEAEVSYLDNIANRKAEDFYRRHGVRRIEKSGLAAADVAECALMTTRYCIRAQLGICPKERQGTGPDSALPLILSDKTGDYALTFDCRRCGMIIRRTARR